MKLNCIAVDDEKLSLDFLEDNINQVSYLQLVAKCKNAFEAAEVLKKEKIDLIIIDVQMPGLNGLQFVKRLVPKPLVIFVTAYENYALDAFNVDAIDYLVKPVAIERFLQATNKALLFSSYNKSVTSEHKPEPEFIFVNMEYNLVKVLLADIMYIDGLRDYIRIHLYSTKKTVLTRITMKGMQELLPSRNFLRIHRSYIVAISAISVIRKDSIQLIDQSTQLPLSEGYKDNINALLGKK